MNIDTLLEAAKYVDSGGAIAEQQFTRGRDEVHSRVQKRPKEDEVSSPILQNRLSGSSPPKRRRSKSPQSSYVTQPHVSGPQHQAVSTPQQVAATVPTCNIPVSSIIQQTPRYTLPNPPVPYHLYAQISQQHVQHQQHLQQNPPPHPHQPPHHVQPPQHLPQPEQQHHVQSANKSPKPPTPLPQQPSPHIPASPPATSPHMVTPQQAIDLLQLAESQGNKYTTLTTATTSPRGGIHVSPSNRHGNMSPRLVHQIVGHNPWGERPISPKSSPGLRPAGESDSADSANDGSGKDKRAGIREVHNKLEKNRRAHLKECFENLRAVIPNMEDKKSKTSNLSILGGANRYIQVLKRKERELEHELDRLVRRKIENQQQLDLLKIKNGMSTSETVKLPTDDDKDDDDDRLVVVEDKDIEVVDSKKIYDDDDQASTSTASEAEEEERKSQEQSRSQSPLHQPVSSHLAQPAYSHSDISTTYHQGLASLHGPSKTGLSHSANEAMLRISAMKEAQATESSRQRHASEEIRSRHPSSGAMGHSPRTTYLQMGVDKVSTVLQNVASQISPTSKKDTSVLVSQSTSAMAGSISRQTVSQLLGKQPIVRQRVRRQLPVSQMPVIQPPLRPPHILPRIMSTPPARFGFTPTTQGVISTSKPVVTVGINSLLAQPSVIHTASTHKTVISNGLVSTGVEGATANPSSKHNVPVLTTPAPLTTPTLAGPLPTSVIGTSGANVSKSLMTASVITQTLPVVTHTGQPPFISPIALQSPTNPGTSLLLTHPAPSYIGLQPSMITQPFIGSFPAARPPHIQVASSTQVTPSSATAQPLVHPSVQPVDALGSSAISLALAQAAIPKQIPQTLTTSFPSALTISSLTSQNTLPSTTHIAPHKQTTFAGVTSAIAPVNSTLTKPKATPLSSGSKGSRNKHGKGVNGKTEIQLTTSKIAETMANLVSNSQTMAKNGHSTTTISSNTTQQSVVVKL